MMRKPFVYSLIVITFAIGLVSTILLPYVQAQNCEINVTKVESPTRIEPGKDFQLTTHFTITCSSSKLSITPQDKGLIIVRDLNSGKNVTHTSFDITVYLGGNKTLSANFTAPSTVTAPLTSGMWSIEVDVAVYSSGQVVALGSTSLQLPIGQVTQPVTTASTSSSVRSTASSTSSTEASTEAPATGNAMSIGTLGPIVVLVIIAVVASVVMLYRKKKPSVRGVSTKLEPKQEVIQEAKSKAAVSTRPQPTTEPNSISTGYADLDAILAGGLPLGYAILTVSPPCDERDLLLQRIIESGLATDYSIYFISRDLGRTQSLASRYPKNFYVFSPQADRVTGHYPNLFKIFGVQNLNELNFTLMKAIEPIPKATKKIIILDILSDVLLEHRALTTRKWLDEFIAKRKAEGFTILGTINPLIASEQETQTIIDLFDGIIEIYEKELRERSRRFLIVKKMYGRKYVETELMLDKDKLF
jgi:KaiC/GvpD/RAD55 family RecA-like ATPase